MKLIFLWLRKSLLFLLFGLAFVGCGGNQLPASGVNMTLEVEPNPPAVGPGHLTVTLTDAAGQSIEGSTLEIVGNMSHAGMQPRWVKARAVAGGRYEAPFVWLMEGDWALTVTATLPDGQLAKRQFNFLVSGEMAIGSDDHESTHAGIPNQGAVIRIVTPQDGAIIEPGNEIKVKIETVNFELGEGGNHWHVYVDGQSPRMIMGQMTETILSDLEPGQHEISVYLSVGSHQDLAEGATISITVTDPAAGDVSLSLEAPELHHD